MSENIVIKQKLGALRERDALFVEKAHTVRTDRFPITKPGVFSIAFKITYSSLFIVCGAGIVLVSLISYFFLNQKDEFDLMVFMTVAGLFCLVLGAIFMHFGIDRIRKRRRHDYYYILVHPDCFIERRDSVVTLIPRHAITGAYDRITPYSANNGPCVQYRKENGALDYYNALPHEYPLGRGLPSPVIKKIREVYGVGDPFGEDEFDEDEY